VVLEKAIAAAPERIVSVLVAEHRRPRLEPLLAALPSATPVYAAGQQVMDAIVGFPIHRGVLALGRRPHRRAEDLLAVLSPSALVVGLMGVANHDNMGGVFRNAAAFGADAVIIDAASCDPLYRKAIRVSVGAALTVPFAILPEGADMVAVLEAAGLDVVSLSPGGEVDLPRLRPDGPCAVLFGAEGPGLPPDVLARTRRARIPMPRGFDSLNLATASGIVLYHFATARRPLS
jgi:tRNA G18 (ribose-2'-O)-methylase SpoU